MAIAPRPPEHPRRRRRGIRSLAELRQALRELAYNAVYILAFIAVVAIIFRITDLLLASLIHVPDEYRILLDLPLAAFTAVQFLRKQESIMEMLGPPENEDQEQPALPQGEAPHASDPHP